MDGYLSIAMQGFLASSYKAWAKKLNKMHLHNSQSLIHSQSLNDIQNMLVP